MSEKAVLIKLTKHNIMKSPTIILNQNILTMRGWGIKIKLGYYNNNIN